MCSDNNNNNNNKNLRPSALDSVYLAISAPDGFRLATKVLQKSQLYKASVS